MPYFRYDDYAALVTELKNKRRTVTKRNKKIKKLEQQLQLISESLAIQNELYSRAKWWLKEIESNHRFTPVLTAEMAIKDLERMEQDDLFKTENEE